MRLSMLNILISFPKEHNHRSNRTTVTHRLTCFKQEQSSRASSLSPTSSRANLIRPGYVFRTAPDHPRSPARHRLRSLRFHKGDQTAPHAKPGHSYSRIRSLRATRNLTRFLKNCLDSPEITHRERPSRPRRCAQQQHTSNTLTQPCERTARSCQTLRPTARNHTRQQAAMPRLLTAVTEGCSQDSRQHRSTIRRHPSRSSSTVRQASYDHPNMRRSSLRGENANT